MSSMTTGPAGTDWERVKREAAADAPIAHDATPETGGGPYDPNDAAAVAAYWSQATLRAELLADPATCAAYLDDALSEGADAFTRALQHVAQARGLALPAGGELTLSDVQAVLGAAGMRLAVAPAA